MSGMSEHRLAEIERYFDYASTEVDELITEIRRLQDRLAVYDGFPIDEWNKCVTELDDIPDTELGEWLRRIAEVAGK